MLWWLPIKQIFILAITVGLAHKLYIMWGIEKSIWVQKPTSAFGKRQDVFFFTNADNFRKSGNITSVGSQFGGQGGSPSKFNC